MKNGRENTFYLQELGKISEDSKNAICTATIKSIVIREEKIFL